MHYRFLVLALCSLCFWGCDNSTGGQEETAEKTSPAAPPQSNLGEEGTAKLMDMVNAYYALKDALVATDAPATDKAAGQLAENTDALQSYIQADSTGIAALQPYLDTVKSGCMQVTGIMDESTEQKRIYFEKISGAMYDLLKATELKNALVYRQYCPMALNDKGAYWLSNDPEIHNPYFGNKMLECGEVTDTLK